VTPHKTISPAISAAAITKIEREDMGQGAAIVTTDHGEKTVPPLVANQWPDMSVGRWHLIEGPDGALLVMQSNVFKTLFVEA